MTATFVVTVDLDAAAVELEGKRGSLPLERIREAILSDCECRLFDCLRYRNAVARVGVQMVTTSAYEPESVQ